MIIRDKDRYINVYDGWESFIVDDWVAKLEQLGFSDVKIAYSGFCSQGDGASFTGNVDVAAFITAHPEHSDLNACIPFASGLDVKLYRMSSMYYHWNTVGVDFNDYNLNPYLTLDGEDSMRHIVWACAYEEAQKLFDMLNCAIHDTARSYMKEIYRELENEFDSLISDEAVLEALAAQELAA